MIGNPSKKEDTCELAINGAAQQLASGDAAAARSQAVLALASCSGEARAKARELQVAADKALAALANCERDFRGIASQLGEHRLQSAGKQLNQQDSACAESPRGKALALQIQQGQTAADSAEAVLRRLLANDDAKGAKAGLDQLLALNREQADLATLRQELQALQTASRTAVNNAQPGTASPAAVPEPQAAKPVVAVPAPANPQHELLQSFLRDAESALSQLKFDAAKTYVESARRVDPNNPQAAALARRIKERELQYLKEETSIK